MREDIKIEIDGTIYVGWEDISKKVNISASLLRARVNRLGWDLEKAVNTSVSKLGKTGRGILYKGKHYQTQEDFVSEIEKDSPFSKTTLKIKIGKLNKEKPDYEEEDLEKLISGKTNVPDQGGLIYLITSLKTGKKYVGITIRSLNERWKAHQSECNDQRINSPLKNEMRKFGIENFTIEEIGREDDAKILKFRESIEIKERNTIFPNGLNANVGGTLGARDVETFNFEGDEYRSLSDLARKKGIEPGTLNQRINSYKMTIKEAVEFEQDLTINWNYRTFENLAEFCRVEKLDYRRVISLRSANYSIDQIVERLIDNVVCPICGTQFKRKSSLHKFCSEKCKWKSKSLSKNIQKEVVNSNGNKRKITFRNKNYESVSKFCRDEKLNRSAFSKCLIKSKGDVDKAMSLYKNRKKRK